MLGTSGWTAADIPDQSGRRAVVTGANRGLGFAAARALARKGAHVVLACRRVDAGEEAADGIREVVPGASLTVLELDLADLDSVRAFAAEFDDRYRRLDVLCNNAGVQLVEREETADGFELHLGVNHFGHFALTGRLLPRLRAAPGESRVVTQSSGMHRRGRIDPDDLTLETYDRWTAYARSKLANLLFAFELDRRLAAAGVGDVTSVACHPGYAAEVSEEGSLPGDHPRLERLGLALANRLFAQSYESGARPMLYAATADGVEGGEYVGPDRLFGMRGPPAVTDPAGRARDEETARRLWSVSQERTGVSFDLPPR